MNMADLLSRQAALQPHGIAVIHGREVIRYGELERLVWKLAGWLAKSGVAPGDVVGLTFDHEVRHLIASLALIRIGAAQIPLPSRDPVMKRNELGRRAGAAVALSGRNASAGIEHPVLVVDFGWLADQRGRIDTDVRAGDLPSAFLIKSGSGTTGRTKLMVETAGQLLMRCEVAGAAVKVSPGDRLLDARAIDFDASKRRRLECVFRGGTNIFLEPTEDFLPACELIGVDHLRLIAKQAEVLLASLPNDAVGLRLPALKSLSMGSSTIGERLRKAIRTKLSDRFVITYSVSETGNVSAAHAAVQERYPGAVGYAGKGVLVEIVGPDGETLPSGEVGEIRLRTPGMVSGYLGDPEATALAFRDGWFYPRDLGSMTEDGVLIHHGRADDMMILDGINIFPREIELALEGHPAVAEALAFPIPHPTRQDLPAAAVILRRPAAEADLLTFCRERIGTSAPQRIVVVEAFPDAARGKVMKRDLARLLSLAATPA